MITIIRVSPFDGEQYQMDIDIDPAQYEAWEMGMLIQEAMPHLTPSEREFIVSGITPEQWDKYIGEDDMYHGEDC